MRRKDFLFCSFVEIRCGQFVSGEFGSEKTFLIGKVNGRWV